MLIGLEARPIDREGTCHVCGREVLLTVGGTDLYPSLM